MERIYRTRPMKYRQWRQIRKEMIALVLTVGALILAEPFINALAWYFVHHLPPR